MNIALSVVTGTYNRLSFLQQMVESVRESIGVGITYEIVLVDGGSTDGTIAWCKNQSDVVLIEQGELLGGIKAFNEGLYAASGMYCVIGNDDIVYLDETLPNALAFMLDNPDVGVGCFYQDRDHPGKWDLSYMPVIQDGVQMNHLYGQVCIVPKWLGDEVGWWGSFPDMRTYGGDNNLSSFILERGFRVCGIQCACISDLKADDELRRINNEEQVAKTRRHGHPDSNAWGKHWTRRTRPHTGMCGAIVKTDGPDKECSIERKSRFMYLPIYEQGHAIQKTQKRGMRDALARASFVYEYDWLQAASQKSGKYMLDFMMDVMDAWKPHILLTQIHSPDAGMFNAGSVEKIRKEFPNITWVNWNGDYHPEDLLSAGNINMVKQFDLQCVVSTMVRDAYTKNGVSWMYWQIGYEDSDAVPTDDTPKHDVVFLANGYSGARLKLGRRLKALKDVNVGIYGSWGQGVQPNGSNLYNFDAGQPLYQAAKLSIGDNQWGDTAVGFVSNRLFQALAAGGAMLLHQRVPGLKELLGLIDGEHYVAWDNLSDMVDKIHYYMSHEKERVRIATEGTKFIRANHSFDARVAELLDVIG